MYYQEYITLGIIYGGRLEVGAEVEGAVRVEGVVLGPKSSPVPFQILDP